MRFLTAESVAQATAALAAEAGLARVLGGGTDLLVQLRAGMIEPALVVDIKRIPGMAEITATPDGGFRIGAAVAGARLAEDAALCAAWPGVAEAFALIGSTQIQGRCTMAGNICNASPAGDSVPALVAAGARARIEGPAGAREVEVIEIAAGPGRTTLGKGEIVTAILLPPRGARADDAYLRFTPRSEMDIAVASAGVSLTLGPDGRIAAARVALGAVGPKVVLCEGAAAALIGTRADEGALAEVAAAATAAARPIDDKRGTIAFRKATVGVLARRAAAIALARAEGKA
ncbi:MAG: FAD binding domain-containing protein [Gemmobacter sp.]